jgi:GNAT superfamily N-acetyltransferase
VLTTASVRSALEGPDLLFSGALEDGTSRGVITVLHARWEEQVLDRPIAKVVLFAADTPGMAVTLARAAWNACKASGVVLVSATPGNSPMYMHVALAEAGFHLAGQSLTVRADLEDIAPAVARIPLRGGFRPAKPSDADAITDIAGRAFIDTRFMSDPHFPGEWGALLMQAWAGNLINGGADEIIVAEAGGAVLGFAAMTLDQGRRQKVPELLAVHPQYDGAGVGAMLVRQMLDWYRTRGVRVFVGVTEKSNVAINALYARLGFTVLDCNLVYHGSPIVGSGELA